MERFGKNTIIAPTMILAVTFFATGTAWTASTFSARGYNS